MLPQVPILNHDIKPTITLTLKQEPKEQLYTIKENDNLSKVAEATHTTVERLWEKNTDLTDPDIIEPGKPLKIPQDSETLTDRPIPVKVMVQVPVSTQISRPSSSYGTNGGFSVSGATYSSGAYGVGWCTSYAAARHPVPSNLGNADSWFYMAQADGLATGHTPQPGAIAVAASYMHVAIVEQVNGDRVYVSEQNYQGYGIVSSRWSPISEWQGYIY